MKRLEVKWFTQVLINVVEACKNVTEPLHESISGSYVSHHLLVLGYLSDDQIIQKRAKYCIWVIQKQVCHGQ